MRKKFYIKKEKQMCIPEELKIKKEWEEAINSQKIPLLLLEEKEYIPDRYAPINLEHLKEKAYIHQDFSMSFPHVYIYKKGYAYAIAKPLTKKDLIRIATNSFNSSETRKLVMLDDKIYLAGQYRAYDLKNETLIEIPSTINFKIYPPTIEDIIPLLLISQEYNKYSIIPCYVDYTILRTLLI